MARSTLPKVKADGKMTITAPVIGSQELDYEQGDVAWQARRRERVVIRDRGVIVAVRKGDEPVITITQTMHALEFTNAVAGNLPDIMEFTGGWATATKTTDIAGDFNFVTVAYEMEGTIPDGKDSVATFLGCIGFWDFAEGDNSLINATWECYGGISYS